MAREPQHDLGGHCCAQCCSPHRAAARKVRRMGFSFAWPEDYRIEMFCVGPVMLFEIGWTDREGGQKFPELFPPATSLTRTIWSLGASAFCIAQSFFAEQVCSLRAE